MEPLAFGHVQEMPAEAWPVREMQAAGVEWYGTLPRPCERKRGVHLTWSFLVSDFAVIEKCQVRPKILISNK